ncbi:MAG TPA: hypothetical protein VEI48_10340 [Candidatus Sulfotelmatobacter sp.]|nr:hypothetical protein [Candidatus Sulfotelmatobacter sp.]
MSQRPPSPRHHPPSGWQVFPWRPPHRAWLWAGLGLPVGLGLGYGSGQLIAAAQSACGDFSPGGAFGLLYFTLPGVVALTVLSFAGGALVGGGWGLRIGHLAGLAVPLAVTIWIVAQAVPAYPGSVYVPDPLSRVTLACGPTGVPTWWPWWLPS